MLLPTTPIRNKDDLAKGTDRLLAILREKLSDPREVRDLTFVLGTLDALAGVGLDALTSGAEGKALAAGQDAWVKKIAETKAAAYGFKV